MKKTLCLMVFFAGLFSYTVPACADFITVTTISSAMEDPSTERAATGMFTLDYLASMQELTYTLSYSGLSAGSTMAQISLGNPSQSGSVLFTLFDYGMTASSDNMNGTVSGILTAADLKTDTVNGIGTFADAVYAIDTDGSFLTVQSLNPNGATTTDIAANPEPATVGLFGASFLLLGFGAYRNRRRQN